MNYILSYKKTKFKTLFTIKKEILDCNFRELEDSNVELSEDDSNIEAI